MGDMGDYWREHKQHKQAIRSKYEGSNIKFVKDWCLENDVFCQELPGTQLRLTRISLGDSFAIDIWPQRLKWHNLTTGKRGQCHNQTQLKELLNNFLNQPRQTRLYE